MTGSSVHPLRELRARLRWPQSDETRKDGLLGKITIAANHTQVSDLVFDREPPQSLSRPQELQDEVSLPIEVRGIDET
jgi:hypothetical protein